MSKLQVLTINHRSISENKAVLNVNELLRGFGFSLPIVRHEWPKKKYVFEFGPKTKKKTYLELFLESRNKGVISSIQSHIDRADDIFGGTFGISTPNFQLPITTSFAGYSKKVASPSRIIPIEQELADDILFYREETCAVSEEDDFEMCCRNYRAFLFSSISLIDAFINRHILIFEHRNLESNDFISLKSSMNLDERINLLVKISSYEKYIPILNKSNAWNDYKLLKDLRNNIIHSIEPFFGHSIPEFAKQLNLIRSGVGELLKMILHFQNKMSLGFVEKLRNAPEVFYNQITIKGDGSHISKKIENN